MSTYLIKLEEEIIKQFSSHWELNDEGHRVEHFKDVYNTGLYINKTLRLNYDPKLILFAAYFHDLFAWSRKNHHLLSEEFILRTDHPLVVNHLCDSERALVAGACRKHRASNREGFSNDFEELINSADRGAPTTVAKMMERASQYRRGKGMTDEALIEAQSIAHLKEKYGSTGYALYPQMYVNLYRKQLFEIRSQIDKL